MTDPEICETEVDAGRGEPFPAWAALLMDAREWHVSPMEFADWPITVIQQIRLLRQAEADARRILKERETTR